MAGHAPEYLPAGGRFERWLNRLSDVRISLYMFVLASVFALALYVVDAQFFG